MEDKLNLLLWAIGGGFAGTWAILFYSLKQIGKLDEKITDVEKRLDEKITDVEKRLDEKITDVEKRLSERLYEIDKRLVAVETTLRIQGACALKEGRVLEKAE